MSVIDLNGFGQSTGDPTFDPASLMFQEGWSNFSYNPNVRLQGSLDHSDVTSELDRDLEKAYAMRPDYLAARAAVDAQARSADAARAGYWPTAGSWNTSGSTRASPSGNAGLLKVIRKLKWRLSKRPPSS